jgi:hypothetical protein
MQSKWPKLIRELLRKEEDGSTVAGLSFDLDAPKKSIASALEHMPDAYIDRWTEAGQGRPYEAIWCVVIPPENCPYPTKKV